MTLLWADSMSHYTTLADKGWSIAATNASISGGNGRLAGDALRVGQSGQVGRNVPDLNPSFIHGFAFKMTSLPTSAGQIMYYLDSGSTQFRLDVNSTGKIVVINGAGTTLGTGTRILAPNVWYYLEVKGTIDNTAGVVVVRIDEVEELNLTSQDTQNTGTTRVNQIQPTITNFPSGAANYFCDMYLSDLAGGAPQNDFLGDCRVEYRAPNGNGNSSQLTGSDGNSTDNYLLVDESPPNGDTDYVESSNVGDKDTYTYQDLTPTAGTVYGVQPVPFAKKTDAGTRNICSVARLSGTEVDSADKVLSTTYQFLPDMRETKPGGGAWSVSDVNSAEFGVKVTA